VSSLLNLGYSVEEPLLLPWQSIVTLGAAGYRYIEEKTVPCSACAVGEKFGFDKDFLIVPLSPFSPGFHSGESSLGLVFL